MANKKTAKVETQPKPVPQTDEQSALIAAMERQMDKMNDLVAADSPLPPPTPVVQSVDVGVPVVVAPAVVEPPPELEPVSRFVEVADQLRHFIDHLTPTERGLARALVQELQEMWQDIPC